MPARKMRVELFDNDGNRYTIAFEGQVTRDKALRLLDLVELLGGVPSEETATSPSSLTNRMFSRYSKVQMVIQKSFPLIWFSSRDVQSVYEQELKEPVGLSTVSTYLSRMASRGVLLRTGGPNNLKYKAAPSIPRASLKQTVR